jgi:NADPH-dependent curcumin reductase CurA
LQYFLSQLAGQQGSAPLCLAGERIEGLENEPAAFLGLLQGKNFGKLLVKVAQAK